MIVVYGDFTDALSWVASMRVDALRRSGLPVEWRAVPAVHTTRVVAAPLGPDQSHRIGDVQRWHRGSALPGEPTGWAAPAVVPWSEPAVSAHAEAVRAGIGDHVRHQLFRSYWQDRLDIGNPDVLRHLLAVPFLHGSSPCDVVVHHGYAVAIGGAPVSTAAWRLAREWRGEWARLGRPELPVVVDEDTTYKSFEAVEHLGSRVRAGDPLPTTAGNPFRLPPMPLPAQHRSIARPGLRAAWWDA
jgi:hypothetical protein